MSKNVVTFGEIMMRLSPPGFLRFGQARSFDVIYGGGEANVAVSLDLVAAGNWAEITALVRKVLDWIKNVQ